MSGTDPEAGFTFVDRRRRPEDAGPAPDRVPAASAAPAREAAAPPRQAGAQPTRPLAADEPRADFASLCVMLYSEALVHLGQVPDPVTGEEAEPDFPRARLTIDMLAMLKEKSQGNRTPEESALLDEIITTLRMGFVELTRRG